MDLDLTVAMIVRDEEEQLPAALASLGDLPTEIVVVDTGSIDRTREVAASHPRVRLLEAPFEGFGPTRQRAHAACRTSWILWLDADERLSPELRQKIRSLHRNGQLDKSGAFRIRRRTWVLGRPMRTMGLDRDAPVRLFRREGSTIPPRPVHEGVEPPAGFPVGRLEECIEHYTFRDLDRFLRKIDLYTDLERLERPRPHSTARLVVSGPSTFLRFYLGRGGWRDGRAGLVYALLGGTYAFVREMKTWIAHTGHPDGLERRTPQAEALRRTQQSSAQTDPTHEDRPATPDGPPTPRGG